jgi:hypothetical protein
VPWLQGLAGQPVARADYSRNDLEGGIGAGRFRFTTVHGEVLDPAPAGRALELNAHHHPCRIARCPFEAAKHTLPVLNAIRQPTSHLLTELFLAELAVFVHYSIRFCQAVACVTTIECRFVNEFF